MKEDLKRDLLKFLRALALFAMMFVVFAATAGAIKAGSIHLYAGIINGVIEFIVIVKIILKWMNGSEL